MLYAGNEDGGLYQLIDTTGLSDFTIDFEFAVLANTNTAWDTFGVQGRSNSAAVWALSVSYDASGNANLMYHTSSSGFVDTGLDVSPTDDINNDRTFDDGESPVINYLTLVGRNFGTSDAEMTFSLTGGAINGSFTAGGSSGHLVPRGADSGGFAQFRLYGTNREIEFLVDNVSVDKVSVAVPEPSSACVFAMGLLGLIGCACRRRQT